MNKCSRCGGNVSPDVRFCQHCAYDLSQPEQPISTSNASTSLPYQACPKCGKTVEASARFCYNCATPLSSNDAATVSHRKTIVIVSVALIGLALVAAIALFLYFSSRKSVPATDSISSGGTSVPLIPTVNPEQIRRDEAIRFCQLLSRRQPDLNRLNSREASLVAEINSWAGQIAFLGGGGQQKSNEANSFSQQAKGVRQQLSQIHQALESEILNVAFNQTTRSNIVASLTQRQRYLSEVIKLLDESAAGLLRVNSFSYPQSIQQLIARLRTYSQAQDNIGLAVKEIRTKFEITDSEMGRVVEQKSATPDSDAPSQVSSESSRSSSAPEMGYFVIGFGSHNQSEATQESQRRNQDGFQTQVVYSSDWSGLVSGWYIVVYGIYRNRSDAMTAQKTVQARGVQVYVKYSGNKLS